MTVDNNTNNNKNWGNIFLSFVLLILAFVIVFIVNKITTPKAEIVLIDNDKDGYFTISANGKLLDCDDNNKDIYPGAPEIAGDNIDQDVEKQG